MENSEQNMSIQILQSNSIRSNTYMIPCSDALVVIDAGAEASRIFAAAEQIAKPICAVLLTHAHFDHIGSAKLLQDAGAKVYLHEDDLPVLEQAFLHGIPAFSPDVLLKGSENLDFNGTNISVIETPGHTAGGVCYLCGEYLFSGDTLFYGDVGRCDLPTGSFETLKKSLKKLFTTYKDLNVFPGHGPSTTLERERTQNRYVSF